jgi:AcrR family transcriptional regulator
VETIPGQRQRLPRGEDRAQAEMLAHQPRERILIALAELVAKRGYAGTSVEHIIKRAVVSRSTFYEVFKNREEALLALFERSQAELSAEIAAAAADTEDWPERVVAVLRAFLAYCAENPAVARTCLVESVTVGARAIERYEQAMAELAPIFAGGRGLSANAAELPDALEDMVVGSVIWLVHQRLLRGEAERIPALLPTAVEIAVSPYLGEKRAAELAATV